MIRVFALLIITTSALGQDSVTNDILTTIKFRKGIYQLADDFKSNTPARTDEFKLEPYEGNFVRYRLLVKDKKVRYAYGCSDGKAIFINAKVYGQSNYFVPILILGPITYFEDQRAKNSELVGSAVGYTLLGGVLIGAATGSLMSQNNTYSHPGWIVYLPDKDGMAYPLESQSLISILEETDTELLEKFKQEKKPDHAKMLDYVLEFNRRHKKVDSH